MFEIKDSDSPNIKALKEEFNIAIERQVYDENTLNVVYKIVKIINDLTLDIINCPNSIDDILNLVKRIIINVPITAIDLIKDETIKRFGEIVYKRYYGLIVENNNDPNNLVVYNSYAYNILYNIEYFVNTKKTNKLKYPINVYPHRVYIIVDNILTNKYITKCYIKDTQFYYNSIVNLDCIRVYYKKQNIDSVFAIKNTSPKYKALCAFYEVPIYIDNEMKEIDLKQFKRTKK